tara:strand:- start:4 stop:195 length:192 start_codon:yes stop_codon:yes gene_type:complete
MTGEILYTDNGEVYEIKRTIPEQQLKNPDMKILKQFFHCDTVLRNQGKLYFCNHIKCVEYEEV